MDYIKNMKVRMGLLGGRGFSKNGRRIRKNNRNYQNTLYYMNEIDKEFSQVEIHFLGWKPSFMLSQ